MAKCLHLKGRPVNSRNIRFGGETASESSIAEGCARRLSSFVLQYLAPLVFLFKVPYFPGMISWRFFSSRIGSHLGRVLAVALIFGGGY
jgi:hypothetical protein